MPAGHKAPRHLQPRAPGYRALTGAALTGAALTEAAVAEAAPDAQQPHGGAGALQPFEAGWVAVASIRSRVISYSSRMALRRP